MSVDPSSCEISECAGVPWYKVGKLGWCGEHKAEAYKAAAKSVKVADRYLGLKEVALNANDVFQRGRDRLATTRQMRKGRK